MKYDQKNLKYILEDFEHISKFIEKEESDRDLERLQKEVPWQVMKWSTGRDLPRMVYRYDNQERLLNRVGILEELRFLVEEVFETEVDGVWCNLYRNGRDFCPFHQDDYNFHVLTLSFGEEREFLLREKGGLETVKSFQLSSGDAYYFSPRINQTHQHSIPKSSKSLSTRISIVFFMHRPYSRRETSAIHPLSNSKPGINIPIMIQHQQAGILILDPSFEGKVPTGVYLDSYQALSFLSIVLSAENLQGEVVIF
jgi:alkylated DNA repair dioxygenase AlkB